jgi:aldehyde:ferredoxin oxidoreductase
MPKTAFVNLTTGLISVTETDAETLHRWLGGRGYAACILFDRVGPGVDPLDVDNLLIFSVGPLTGTLWPTAGRYHVTFKSPLTGAYGYANGGGFFGPELAHIGYDALVISGRASSPVLLHVTPDAVEILPADPLWGLEVSAVEERLAGSDLKRGRVACIGPAGENLVRFAGIISDRSRAAARCGGGAVMGSKNLKAVWVEAQGRKKKVPAEFKAAAREASHRLTAHPGVQSLSRWGTAHLIASKNASGDLPAKNHQLPQVPFVNRVDAEALDGYVVEHKGCYACPIRCGRVSHVPSGPYATHAGGPEYETIDALGPMCWLDDMAAIIHANWRCNELGLDTISTGVVIAFAMECHQRGLLRDAELSLTWGDPQTVLGLIERIARREGIGELLAEGTARAAGAIGPGAEPLAMQVKGMELPRQEPRIAKGFGLGHATSNRGADHLYALPTIDLAGAWEVAERLFPDLLPDLMDVADESYKADMVVYSEHYNAVSDALGICKFSTTETYALFPEDVARGLSLLLGREITGDELLHVGERIVNLERLYNVRQGFTRAQDRLPRRFTTEAVDVWVFTPHPETGEMVRSAEPVRRAALIDLERMLDRYYALRGWTSEGVPIRATLRRLGLEAIAEF